MQIVIDISEKEYTAIKRNEFGIFGGHIYKAIRNGIPLPKGHGRLGDLDALHAEVSSWGMNDYEPSDFTYEIDEAPTIIEADKSEDI